MANETKWTPGPWRVGTGHRSDGRKERQVWSSPGLVPVRGLVARVYSAGEYTAKADADARLIAAAPDLYEALAEQATDHCSDGSPCFCGNADAGDHPAYCRSARAALAKARGEEVQS